MTGSFDIYSLGIFLKRLIKGYYYFFSDFNEYIDNNLTYETKGKYMEEVFIKNYHTASYNFIKLMTALENDSP
jgi:hypothetical protein